jgi:uncharacterized protein
MNLKSFRISASKNHKRLTSFLKKFDKKFIPELYPVQMKLDSEVWQEVDCLSCANCCKTMTPTFTAADKKRIAAYLNTTPRELYKKYFEKDPDNGDTVNKIQPCQWLDLKDNKCSIYEVRPLDCSTFPHHNKKKFDDYNHVYQQNIDKCPATYKLVLKMEQWINENYKW